MLLSYVIWFVTVLWIVFWVECSSTAASLCRALLKDVGRRVVHEHFHGGAGLSRSQLGLHLQPCSGSSSWVEHHCTEDSVSCYFLFLLRGNFNVSLRNYSEHWVNSYWRPCWTSGQASVNKNNNKTTALLQAFSRDYLSVSDLGEPPPETYHSYNQKQSNILTCVINTDLPISPHQYSPFTAFAIRISRPCSLNYRYHIPGSIF